MPCDRRSLNDVWKDVWCARDRVRVLIEVLPGGDGDCGDRRDVAGRAGTICVLTAPGDEIAPVAGPI